MGKESIKLVANNKKAYHDYFIDEKYEAGIEGAAHRKHILKEASACAVRVLGFLCGG